MKRLYLHSFKTKSGIIRTAATERGLVLIGLPNESESHWERMLEKRFAGYKRCRGGIINKEARKQIVAFLGGKRRQFDLPLDISTTPFQKKVLRCVSGIPYGRTLTYGEVAKAVGHPRAARAVGMANASNSLPLVIPCHRVVAVNGLGGYGGGLALKRSLLEMENSGN